MIHLGHPKMCKKCSSAKIREELDKVKEKLPKTEIKAEVIDADAIMKAASGAKSKKPAAPASSKQEPDEEPETAQPTAKATKKPTKRAKSKAGGKKEPEEDFGEIVISNAKAKAQRSKDDHKSRCGNRFSSRVRLPVPSRGISAGRNATRTSSIVFK